MAPDCTPTPLGPASPCSRCSTGAFATPSGGHFWLPLQVTCRPAGPARRVRHGRGLQHLGHGDEVGGTGGLGSGPAGRRIRCDDVAVGPKIGLGPAFALAQAGQAVGGLAFDRAGLTCSMAHPLLMQAIVGANPVRAGAALLQPSAMARLTLEDISNRVLPQRGAGDQRRRAATAWCWGSGRTACETKRCCRGLKWAGEAGRPRVRLRLARLAAARRGRPVGAPTRAAKFSSAMEVSTRAHRNISQARLGATLDPTRAKPRPRACGKNHHVSSRARPRPCLKPQTPTRVPSCARRMIQTPYPSRCQAPRS